MKNVLVISDLSCTGRASILVADAVLSYLGHNVSALPTAIFSTQTGGVESYEKQEFGSAFATFADSFCKRGLKFDCIMTGWLESGETARTTNLVVDRLLAPKGILAVDPVLGDDGRFYDGFDDKTAAIVKELMARADYAKPNMTELRLLAGATATDADAARLAKTVLLSGIERDDKIGVRLFSDKTYDVLSEKVEGFFHGAGDVFFSGFVGLILAGVAEGEALRRAVNFVSQSIKYSASVKADATAGVIFEPFLRCLLG